MNVAHGDVTKENILISQDGSVCIVDYETGQVMTDNDEIALIRADIDDFFHLISELKGDLWTIRGDMLEFGRTVLHEAAWRRNGKVVQILLDAGADVSTKDYLGETALHVAARCGDVELVMRLLDAGANVAANDNVGWPPLHDAVRYGRYTVVKLLLDAGADVTTMDNDGRTAKQKEVTIQLFGFC